MSISCICLESYVKFIFLNNVLLLYSTYKMNNALTYIDVKAETNAWYGQGVGITCLLLYGLYKL